MEIFYADVYFTFHIYDSRKKESFEIVGKSKFMDWLNDHASAEIASTEDCNRYLFFSTYDKLKKYLEDIKLLKYIFIQRTSHG